MAKVKTILEFLEHMAPPAMKMDFDNVGLLVGYPENEVSRVIVALDITEDVIEEAVHEGAQLIVSHHPLLFSLKAVRADDYIGVRVIKLIENSMSAICMHTNLDAAEGGVNDALAKAAGIISPKHLKKDGVLIVNDTRIDPMTVVIGAKEYPEGILENLKKNHEIHAIDGQKLALDVGNPKVLNSVVLGFAASFIGFDKELWLDTVASTVPPKTIDINKKAFELGYEV